MNHSTQSLLVLHEQRDRYQPERRLRPDSESRQQAWLKALVMPSWIIQSEDCLAIEALIKGPKMKKEERT